MENVTLSKTGEGAILMEPKDLRIGNILLYDEKYVHVTTLSMDIDDEYEETIGFCYLGKTTNEICSWNRSLCDRLKPIALTDVLLEVCGFVILSVGSSDTSYYLESSEFDFFVYKKIADNKIYYDDFEIPYLHQLQNLIFALTNQDLPNTKLLL